MGEVQPNARRGNGGVTGRGRGFNLWNGENSYPPPDPSAISQETWEIAEAAATEEVLSRVSPTFDSEELRSDVFDFLQTLFRRTLGIEVFAYGSVPLKTYLPDGDIDLTALSTPNIMDTLPAEVLAVLQAAQLNHNADYAVREIRFIDAEVKVVRCLVHNIVIDVSFNQMGGLSTLCFLEQVDRLVGRQHLFKRSILLVKAWCYYESRILGAHHGLLSTYALEALILYVFQLFNASLNGPLEVLYRFLDYFSKFDWENCCISLRGPVCKWSFPDIVVKNPGNGGADLMLSEEYVARCINTLTVSSDSTRVFPKKFINIIDPLKGNNNLGRSVNKGNYYRICSAFKYGARELGRILLLPRERISDEIKMFFQSTLDRNGPRRIVQIIGDELVYPSFSDYGVHFNPLNGYNYYDIKGVENSFSHILQNELSRYSMQPDSIPKMLETSFCPEGHVVTGYPLAGNVTLTNTASACSLPRKDLNDSFPTFCNSESLCADNVDDDDSLVLSPDDNVSDNLSFDFGGGALASILGDMKTNLNLSDLTGDYHNNIRSLAYGMCCNGFASAPPAHYSPVAPASALDQLHKRLWASVSPYMPLKLRVNPTGAPMGQAVNLVNNHPMLSPAAGCLEENQKARGTGTYIPNVGYNSFSEKHSQGKRMNQAQETHSKTQRRTRKNGNSSGTNSSEEGGQKLKQAQYTASPNENIASSSQQVVSEKTIGIGGSSVSARTLEFGSFGPVKEDRNKPASENSKPIGSTSLAMPEVQNFEQAKGIDHSRIEEKGSLNLHDDADFPPLSHQMP